MHRPEGVKGEEYIALVAGAAMVLAKNLTQTEICILAEFMQAVSLQLFTLSAFKDTERKK